MTKLSVLEIEIICNRYRCGEHGTTIARAYGVKDSIVYRHLHNNHVVLRSYRNQLENLSSPDQHCLIDRYIGGASLQVIADELGVTGSSVGRFLHRHGVTPRTPWAYKRKFYCDFDYFSVINTEAKAYWLGFLTADVYMTGQGLRLLLGAKDEDHLDRFSQELHSTYPKFQRWTTLRTGQYLSIGVLFSSTHLLQDLAQYGVVPNKTFSIRWPSTDLVPASLQRHFLRGYFDGDGCWVVTRRKRTGKLEVSWSVTSNRWFCNAIRLFVASECRINLTKLGDVENPDTAVCAYSGWQNADRIVRLLYTDASVWLPRKREKIEAALLQHPPARRLTHEDHLVIAKRYVAGEQAAVIARDLEVTYAAVLKVLEHDGVPRRKSGPQTQWKLKSA